MSISRRSIIAIVTVLVLSSIAGYELFAPPLLESGEMNHEVPVNPDDAVLGCRVIDNEESYFLCLKENVSERVNSYFNALQARDPERMLSFYLNSTDTVVRWSGLAGYFAGTYDTIGEIRLLAKTFVANTIDIKVSIMDYRDTTLDETRANVTMKVLIQGVTVLEGGFEMESDVMTVWQLTDGQWMIVDDRWDITTCSREEPIRDVNGFCGV